jgi:hypothetical protein
MLSGDIFETIPILWKPHPLLDCGLFTWLKKGFLFFDQVLRAQKA